MGVWGKARDETRGGWAPQGDPAAVDLSAEMERLAASLGPLAYGQAPGHGRVLQFASARTGEGTSTVAREFARLAAQRLRRPIWLIDTDLTGATQSATISAHPAQYGRMGGAAGGSPDGSSFFTVRPQAVDAGGAPVPPARYLVAHPVGGPNLWVTRFRRELMAPGQSAYVTPGSAYWDVMRRHAELIIIDAPSAEQSQASIMLAPHADATVLVVAADAGDARPPALLKSAMTAAGGRVAGLFFNRCEIESLPILRAITP